MHMFIFGGLSLSTADYMKVGRFCSSRQGGKGWCVCGPTGLMRAVLIRSTLQG